MACCGRPVTTGAGRGLVTSGDLAAASVSAHPIPAEEDGSAPLGARFKLVDRADGETLYFGTHPAAAAWQRDHGGGLLRTV